MISLASATDELAAAGCDSPRLDAELLLCEVLGINRAELFLRPAQSLSPRLAERFAGLVARRARREPIAYILGWCGFRRIELMVDWRVLIPRPDTETLVEAALGLASAARVHDVGTGSGAVALAIKDERPDLAVSGSDISAAALTVACANAERLGLDVDLLPADGLPPGTYDLVVANLPYVADDELAGLEPEVATFEPRQALLGGADGLDAIRALVAQVGCETRLALEHAPHQAGAIRDLLAEPSTLRDLAGRERVTIGKARRSVSGDAIDRAAVCADPVHLS